MYPSVVIFIGNSLIWAKVKNLLCGIYKMLPTFLETENVYWPVMEVGNSIVYLFGNLVPSSSMKG